MANSLDNSSDTRVDLSMDLCTDISEFEIGSDVELFSDADDILIDEQECKPLSLIADTDGDIHQSTVHHQRKDTTISTPIAIANPAQRNVAHPNSDSVKTCDRPLSEEDSMIVLMDSKEQICSQVHV